MPGPTSPDLPVPEPAAPKDFAGAFERFAAPGRSVLVIIDKGRFDPRFVSGVEEKPEGHRFTDDDVVTAAVGSFGITLSTSQSEIRHELATNPTSEQAAALRQALAAGQTLGSSRNISRNRYNKAAATALGKNWGSDGIIDRVVDSAFHRTILEVGARADIAGTVARNFDLPLADLKSYLGLK